MFLLGVPRRSNLLTKRKNVTKTIPVQGGNRYRVEASRGCV